MKVGIKRKKNRLVREVDQEKDMKWREKVKE